MKATATAKDFAALLAQLANGVDPNKIWKKRLRYSSDPATNPEISVLQWALEGFPFEAADHLLCQGAEIDLCNRDGLTVLQEVILSEDEEAVAFLLTKGANPDRLYPDGSHPLHFALQRSNIAIFRHLVNAMSELAIASSEPWSIMDLAILAGDHEALDILSERSLSLKASLQTTPTSIDVPEDVPEQWKSPSKAKRLLAFCSSSLLIPPADLRETYAYAMYLLIKNYRGEVDITASKTMINGVFQGLYDAAFIARPTSRVTLCQACLSFQQFACSSGKSKPYFQIHQDHYELDECAKSCPLCRLISDAFVNAKHGDSKSLLNEHQDECCEGKDSCCRFCKTAEPENNDNDTSASERTSATAIRLQLRYDIKYPLTLNDHTFMIVEDRQRRLVAKLPVDTIDEAYLLDTKHSVGLDASTGSWQSFDLAARWLDECRNSSKHHVCQKAYREISPRLPTRVIDLSSYPTPRLVETGGTRSIYCALSYCWGKPGLNLTTIRANISKHKQGIPINSLPVFIQETLIAAKALNYRYIWIDAICIIQDDPDDWDKEASKMRDVYANADLTISSLTAKGCQESLFHSRGPYMTRPVPFDIWIPKVERQEREDKVIHQYAIYPSYLMESGNHSDFSGGGEVAENAPITSRGWVLQEQMLSTRMLYFGGNCLVWECLCLATPDIDPSHIILPRTQIGLGTLDYQKREVQGATQSHDISNPNLDDLKYQPYGIWKSLLTSYTERHLTKSSDRIPAFLAISKYLESAIGGEFIGGVWKGEKLLDSLAWNVENIGSRQAKAPSWSWASVNQVIDFNFIRRGWYDVATTPLATVISFDVQANQPQSQITGSITLRTTLHEKEVRRSSIRGNMLSDDVASAYDYHAISFDHEAGVTATCYAADLVGLDRSFYDGYEDVESSADDEFPAAAVIRLLLEPVSWHPGSNLPHVFRRIGICRDHGHREEELEHRELPRKDNEDRGLWEGVIWSEADRLVTIV
ncbi:hypothetical protein ACHAP5_005909 [Fusarium lateritium]